MTVIIIILSMLLVVLLVVFKRRPQIKESDFDLKQPAKLRLVRGEYLSEYEVQWWHPLYEEWWYLPKGYAYLSGRWSLVNAAGYGAYDSNKMECDPDNFERLKRRFSTIGDIKEYLDSFGKEWDRWQEQKKKLLSKPNVYY